MGGANFQERGVRHVCKSSCWLVEWGNGGTVHKRFVGGIGGDRISKKLRLAAGQREKRLGKYRHVKEL